ncbi:MAG TPA: hypothetical protein VF919_11495 [Gemmatimonadales bacterium]
MSNVRKSAAVLAAGVLVVVAWSVWAKPQKTSSQPAPSANDQMISNYAQEMLKQGKEMFRFDTFGDEAFWGDASTRRLPGKNIWPCSSSTRLSV